MTVIPRLRVLALAAAAFCVLAAPTTARDWHGQPSTVAPGSVADYVTITDTRADGDFVVVWWLSSQLTVGDPQAGVVLTGLLAKYVVIATVHGQQTPGGPKFESASVPAPMDADGKPLAAVAEGDWPNELKGFIALTRVAMIAGFQKRADAMPNPVAKASMAEAANNIRFTVFTAGAVMPCKPGQLRVGYINVTYTFDLPLPGCQVPI